MSRTTQAHIASVELCLVGSWLVACAPTLPPSPTWLAVLDDDPAAALRSEPWLNTRMLELGSVRVRVAERGLEGAKTPTPWVFVHGLGGSMQDFAGIITRIPSSVPVLAVDLPGFGGSWDTDSNYRIARFADIVALVLSRFELPPAHLVCHSLGAQVCLGIALDHRDRVATLTLIDAAGTYNQSDFLLRASRRYVGVNVGTVETRSHPAISFLTRGSRPLLTRVLGGNAFILAALDSFAHSYRHRLHEVVVPTLIIWGVEDPLFFVENAFDLNANISTSELRLVDGAGHTPQESHAELVLGWIQALHARASAAPDGRELHHGAVSDGRGPVLNTDHQ